ncbi:hypothetical protein FHR49_002261 [Xanthomonas campestris]
MLPDRFNPRVRLRDWLNKPSRAELARPSQHDLIISTVANDVAAGRVKRAYEANFSVAVDRDSGRIEGLRKVSGSESAGSWKPSR